MKSATQTVSDKRTNEVVAKMTKRFKSSEGQRLLYESYDRLLGLWGVDKEELYIETRYGTTHVIATGDTANPPLLLFHGSGDNSSIQWLSNMHELAKHFHVIAVDSFAGAGKSEPNERYSKEFDPALWIDDILNALAINKTHMAGVSYGVNLALTYAAENPDRVSRIVCMAAYVHVKGIQSHLQILRSLRVFFPEALIPTETKAIKLFQKLCGPNFNTLLLNQELMNHWFYILKYTRLAKQKMTKFNDEAIAAFRDKALFLIGDSDRVVYHPSVIKMFNAYNLNYKIIKNAGHVINGEQPELINKEIIRFLSA
ncbi:MAG: alpha/beta hydrolase [Bacillota bacterium]